MRTITDITAIDLQELQWQDELFPDQRRTYQRTLAENEPHDDNPKTPGARVDKE